MFTQASFNAIKRICIHVCGTGLGVVMRKPLLFQQCPESPACTVDHPPPLAATQNKQHTYSTQDTKGICIQTKTGSPTPLHTHRQGWAPKLQPHQPVY